MTTQSQDFVTLDDLKDAMGATLYSRLGLSDGADLLQHRGIASVIETVNDTVASALRKRYTLPMNPIPPAVRSASLKLARYEISSNFQPHMRDADESEYEKALDYLEGVGSGKYILAFSPEDRIESASSARTPRIGRNSENSIVNDHTWGSF